MNQLLYFIVILLSYTLINLPICKPNSHLKQWSYFCAAHNNIASNPPVSMLQNMDTWQIVLFYAIWWYFTSCFWCVAACRGFNVLVSLGVMQNWDAFLVFLLEVDMELLFDDADVASDAALMVSKLDALQVERRSRVCCFVNSIPFVHWTILKNFEHKELHQLTKLPMNNQSN